MSFVNIRVLSEPSLDAFNLFTLLVVESDLSSYFVGFRVMNQCRVAFNVHPANFILYRIKASDVETINYFELFSKLNKLRL
jgi:hypothetical protein